MNDKGMDWLLGLINRMEYGYGEIQTDEASPISYKKHNGLVSQVSFATAQSTRIKGWDELIAYYIEKGRAYITAAENGNNETHKLSIVLEIGSDGRANRIIENDYITTHFKTPS